jgi:hypothetical protein
MSANRELTATSISIPVTLYKQGKLRAERSFRTFSQYVSYLIDQDIKRDQLPPPTPMQTEASKPVARP